MQRKTNRKAISKILDNVPRRVLAFCAVVLFLQFTTIYAQETLRFAIIGDFGSDDANEEDVANLVKSWNPAFIITTGDNNYPDGEAATIDKNIGKYYHEFIYPYTGTYGPGAATNRFFPSLGNHDWDNRVGAPVQPYLDYFTLPGNERYYDFVWGLVHFFSIDSDSREPDGIRSNSVQAAWLRDKLLASTAQWKIVYMHHPPYSSRTSWSKLQWDYHQWGANVVLAGHAHVYERIMRDGIAYITNGLGGDSTGSFDTLLSGSVNQFGSNYGAMLVELSVTSITFKFITRAGETIDTYTLGPDAIPPNTPGNLTATSSSNSQMNLTWTDNALNEDGYRIERSTDGGSFTEIGSVIANNTAFTVTGLSAGNQYAFRVRGVNNAGFSAYSNIAGSSGGTSTPPAAPSNLTATAASAEQINLSWTDASTNESGFKIERCLGADCTNFAEIAQTPANISTYQDSGLTADTTYNYRVRAFNVIGNSGYTNDSDATTLPTPPGPTEPPSNLSATAVSQSQINLSWTDDSNNEEGFKIERCTGAQCINFAEIAQVAENVSTYSDTGLQADTTYLYRVRAFANNIDTAYSNTAQATTTTGSPSVFSDDFNDGVRDPLKWEFGLFSRNSSYFDPLVQVIEQNGFLTITPLASQTGNHYNGYVSVGTFNLTNSKAGVEVVQIADNKAITTFAIGLDKDNFYKFRAKGNKIYLEARINGTTSKNTSNYNPTADRFWRFRHDPAADTIVFETSPDNFNWAVRRTIPRQIPITAILFELVGGSSGAINSPGMAEFDNFRLESN